MARPPSQTTVPGVARPSPPWTLHVETGNGDGPAALRAPGGGARTVGSDLAGDLPVADLALRPRHFVLTPSPEGIELAPLGPATVNGRPAASPLRLCDGDRIAAGRSAFVLEAQRGGGFPMARVGDTFWTVMSEAAGWQIAGDAGLARNAGGMLENLSLVHDRLTGWRNLKSYVLQQRRLLASVHDELTADLFQGNPHYDCAETAYLSARFLFGGKTVTQLQFYGLKQDQVGVATWSVPPDLAGQDARFAHFEALLGLVHFH